EEDWLFEAITETYIPLLRMMQRLVNDEVPFKLTMSITPTLCAILQDELLRERYVRHLELLIDLTQRERKRNRTHSKLRLPAGSFWMHTASRLEDRRRADRFTRRITHRPDQPFSRATASRAGRSGVRTKVIPVIRPTVNFIATSASIFRWSIWARSHAEAENFPA